MKIVDIRATTVTVPLEAPLQHATGAHWGRFVRTIVEVETDDGLIGLGEMGGGGESAEAAFRGLLSYLKGHNPFRLEELRFKICNPTASLYNNRTQLHAAIEFACLDLIGQKLGVPVYDLLGGKVRDEVEFASYLFFRYANPETGNGEVRTPDQLVEHALGLKAQNGFRSHKLKGGVYPPDYELTCYRALAAALPDDSYRYDPNAALSVEEGIRFGHAIEDLRNDFLEDPTWGINGMRRVRSMVRVPLATNTVVVTFEQLAANILDPAIDVILLDTTFWGGIRPCIKAAGVCETFQYGVAVHSSGELGNSARDHAASWRGHAESLVFRRRALPPPDRRCHRWRVDALRERVYPRSGRTGPRRDARPGKAAAVSRALSGTRRLHLRPRSWPSRLVRAGAERALGGSVGVVDAEICGNLVRSPESNLHAPDSGLRTRLSQSRTHNIKKLSDQISFRYGCYRTGKLCCIAATLRGR